MEERPTDRQQARPLLTHAHARTPVLRSLDRPIMPEQLRTFFVQAVQQTERAVYEGRASRPWETKGHSLPPAPDKPTKKQKPSAEQLQEIRQRIQQGERSSVIAHCLNVDAQSVYNLRSKIRQACPSYMLASPKQQQQERAQQRLDRIRQGTAEGMTSTELAKELGTTKAAIQALKSKNGIVTPVEVRVVQQARAQRARRERERQAGRSDLPPEPEPAPTPVVVEQPQLPVAPARTAEPARTHVLDWAARLGRIEFEGEPEKGKPKKARARKVSTGSDFRNVYPRPHMSSASTINPVRQSAQLIAPVRKAKAASLYAQAPASASEQAQKARKAAELAIFGAGGEAGRI
jgi:hypothetical protein